MSLGLAPLDGQLELRGLLGEGGMGQVHRAWDRRLERAVAVKFVRGQDPRDAERLLIEARLQARVEHPHVVRVHEVGTLGERPCIVLQLVEGRSLAELAPGLPLADRVELVRQAATGIHAAHLQGLVHRDVKPGNVLVEEGAEDARTALLTDFGLARGEESGLTRTGLPPGTLDYMSPEQLVGPGPVDYRSDVYGLGAALYAVLAGRAPYRTQAPDAGGEDDMQLVRRILEEVPEPLGSAAPGVPRELETIALKALEKDPAARYPSAEAFAEDLSRFQRGEPIRARPATLGERVAKWTRRNRTAARALAAAALALLLAGGFALWRSREAGREALEAARVGAAAQEMESVLRIEQLSPEHDLRPAYGRIRAVMARVAAGGRRVAAGPAAHALGRGHQLLGEWAEAHRELSLAWTLGDRSANVARALGELEGELYARELARLPRVEDPARRAALVGALQRRYRDPAVARLRGLSAATEEERELLSARIALVEERYPEAATGAARARALGAGLEATVLEGRAMAADGDARVRQRDIEGARRQFPRAERALREAAAIGRSAPAPRLLLARLEVSAAWLEPSGPDRMGRVAAAKAWLREAERLDPDSLEVALAWSDVLALEGSLARGLGQDGEPALAEAIRQAERAASLAPDSFDAQMALANACKTYARTFMDSGRALDEAWEKGLRAAGRAAELAPGSSRPGVILASMLGDRSRHAAERGRDGLADAEAALKASRALLEQGDRPTASRQLLASAWVQVARSRFARGEDASNAIGESLKVFAEAVRMAPDDVYGLGFALEAAWLALEQGIAVGSPPPAAMRAAREWVERSLALAGGNFVFAAQAGEIHSILARAEALDGADPMPSVERAEALLRPVAKAGHVYDGAWMRLGEMKALRAERMAKAGRDPGPLLREAAELARRTSRADPTSWEAWALEARCLLEEPGERGRARRLARADAASARAVEVRPRSGDSWALRGRVLAARGDSSGASEALARAEAAQPRLASVARLRDLLAAHPSAGNR